MMPHTLSRRSGFVHSGLLFALSQAVLLAGIAVAAVWARPVPLVALPPLQSQPLNVRLPYNWPEVVTDDQLAQVLWKLRPQLRGPQPKINHVDHALRFWGSGATFNDPACLSGSEMVALLTDQRAFRAAWGEGTSPLLEQGEFGPGFRTQKGAASASHVDHTLATLAEIGLALDSPIILQADAAPIPLRDLLVAAMRDFRLNQKEYEWTTVAAASYATGPTHWISQDGEIVTFDLLADRLMRQEWNLGVCYGNHRLYSLALLLQFNEEVGLFQHPETRSRVLDHLSEATARLVASQSPQGYWDENWPDASRPAKEAEMGGPLSRRILATGHALEWWAIAPAEVLPPRETVVRGGQWLVQEIERMEPATVQENYTFLTHVGRALCLWRGQFPGQWIATGGFDSPSFRALSEPEPTPSEG